MPIASAFLSHSWHDKEAIVHPVAEALGRRGIVPWEDQFELIPENMIREHIRKALIAHPVMVLFLSEAALKSKGVNFEIRTSLELAEEMSLQTAIIPVFLGDRDSLVRRHPLLARRWLSPSGKGVNVLGIEVPDVNDPTTPDRIADGVAWNIYDRMRFRTAHEVVLVLDQRGDGARTGAYSIPPNIEAMQAPTLIFRPDMGDRKQRQLLLSDTWESFARQVRRSLSRAINNLPAGPEREVHLLGHYQESLGFLIGRHLNRTTRTTLYAHGPHNVIPFSNEGWPRHEVPTSGDSAQPVIDQVRVQVGKVPTAALFIGRERYRGDVEEYLETPEAPPLVAFEFEVFFEDSDQAFTFLQPILSYLQALKQEKRLKRVLLFSSLPVTVTVLLATYLTEHLVRVDFMERDHEQDTYRHVPMPE